MRVITSREHAAALFAAYDYHAARAERARVRANLLYATIIGCGLAGLPLAFLIPNVLAAFGL